MGRGDADARGSLAEIQKGFKGSVINTFLVILRLSRREV